MSIKFTCESPISVLAFHVFNALLTFGSSLIHRYSTMASFFDKVPLEVREQVYRELLVNQDGAIELDGRYCNKRKLYTAILRTCKQAYTEASAVLYEQNHFRFESWPEATSLDRNGILEGNFARIKQVSYVPLSIY